MLELIVPGMRKHGFTAVAVLSGTILGAVAFLVKLFMVSAPLDSGFFIFLISNPLAWMAGVGGIAGFLLFQLALSRGKVTIVAPLVAGLGMIVPVIMAFAILQEPVSTAKWIGIVLIAMGVGGLSN